MRRLTRWSEARLTTAYTGAVTVGFVAAVLGPALLGLRTLISVNSLTAFFPWRAGGLEVIGHQRCTGDTIDTVMPSIAYLRDQWLHGHLGTWQGYVGGGSPLGALPNLGLLDPLSLPYFVLPLWMAPAFVKLLELLVAGGGTYLFLRRLGVSRAGGLLAGLVFGTSGFMVMWSNWPQTRVAALIPPLFWAVERLVQRLRPSDVALVGLVVGSLVVGGFPAVTAWALEAAGAYFLFRLVTTYRRDVRRVLLGIGLGVTGIVTGALLAMIELLPFVKFYTGADTEVRSSYGLLPLAGQHLITLIAPGAYGLCVGGEHAGDTTSPIENVTYIGAAAVVLAIVGACVRHRLPSADGGSSAGQPSNGEPSNGAGGQGPRSFASGITMYFTVAAAAILVIGWTSRSVLQALQSVPPFYGNPVGRIRSVLGFALAVLVGFGFDAIVRPRARLHLAGLRPSRSWIRPAVIVVASTAVGAYLLYLARKRGILGGHWVSVKPTLYVPALLVLVTVGVLLLAATGIPWTRRLAVVVLPLLVAGQGAFFFHRVLPGDDPDNFYPRTGVHRFLDDHLGADRYDATGMVMYPSTALYYSQRVATGHAWQTAQWVQLLRAVDPAISLSPTFTAFSGAMTPEAVGASKILDRMGIRYWVFSPDVVAGDQAPLPPATARVELPAPGGASCTLASGPVRGVTVGLAAPLQLTAASRPVTFTVTARNGTRTVSSSRAVVNPVPAGGTLALGIPGEDFGPGPTDVTVQLNGAAAPVALQASGGGLSCAPIRPRSDGLRLVAADAGGVVYQRLSALERIRWAGSATVIADPGAQVQALAAGVPAGTVVLPAASGQASGRGARVTVTDDRGGRIQARVVADGAGYLTVADAMTVPGWSVTIDGKPAKLLVGDHALAAVAVPAGEHTVSFGYRAPGLAGGIALSCVGLALVVGLLVFDRVLLRRRRAVVPASPRAAEPDDSEVPAAAGTVGAATEQE